MTSAFALLWKWYADTLVLYSPDSWVASTASTFRVLALLTIAPGILLTLLDVTSYVIARTLGDPTASTSARFIPLPPSPPPEVTTTPPPLLPRIVVGPASPISQSSMADELAGVGVFSPAASAPGSPVLTRKTLSFPTEDGESGESTDKDGARVEGEGTEGEGGITRQAGESFGGESYAVLERDESWEDAGVQIRRRAPARHRAGP